MDNEDHRIDSAVSCAWPSWNDIKGVWKDAADLLETNTDNLHIMDFWSFPRSYMATKHTDKLVGANGPVSGIPLVILARANSWTTRKGFGLMLFETKNERKLRYILYAGRDKNGFNDLYIICKKGELFALKRHAIRMNKISGMELEEPVLKEGLLDKVSSNTIGFLINSKKIEKYGVKIKRGIVLDGPPGNGKTMMCRYIQKLCDQHGINWGMVTSSDMDAAYGDGRLADLFNQYTVTFFDDIDISYLNRSQGNGKMACSLLSAMDGMKQGSHLIRIFTTNETIESLDAAFTRPGRIDSCITFNKPDRKLRMKLALTWPQEILDNINLDQLVRETDKFSFAEFEAIRGLLVTNKIVGDGIWDLDKAMEDFVDRQQEQSSVPGFSRFDKKEKATRVASSPRSDTGSIGF